VSIQEVTSSKS